MTKGTAANAEARALLAEYTRATTQHNALERAVRRLEEKDEAKTARIEKLERESTEQKTQLAIFRPALQISLSISSRIMETRRRDLGQGSESSFIVAGNQAAHILNIEITCEAIETFGKHHPWAEGFEEAFGCTYATALALLSCPVWVEIMNLRARMVTDNTRSETKKIEDRSLVQQMDRITCELMALSTNEAGHGSMNIYEHGVTEVKEDSVFRIGSGSKLITAYLFLIEVGMKYWGHPITDFVPELAAAARNCSASPDPVDCTDWSEITLGALASHMAGIRNDYSTPTELLLQAATLPGSALVAPQLPTSAIPPCGYNFTNACSEKQYTNGLAAEHPIYAPSTTPVYSNAGYEVLGFALENTTGRSYPEMLQKDLFDKLRMKASSYYVPKDLTNAVMPGGPVKSYFTADLGGETPAGGLFSSQADMIKLGQSILTAALLSPTTIRQWMKPVTFTSNLNQAVGMPWEIWRDTSTDHVIDIYTKQGDLFAYSSLFVLIPDFNVGFVVLAVGTDTTDTVEYLSDTIIATIIPALEDTAREQAHGVYAGTYRSTNSSQGSNMTLTTNPGEPGMVVKSWFSGGINLLPILSGIFLPTPGAVDVRLYPTNLVQQLSPSKQRISYRMMTRALAEVSDGGEFSSDCEQWAMTNSRTYGNVGIDEVVFEVEDGKAVSVSPRALRSVYLRVA
ncbi:hypothetical protein LTR62_008348 [Meristemomyces frigidus]|uniref:Beta-lactamase-related domain-containing protein n=1 Tax=Meristemomyces frigidus TaxID=1508187 RepID=A0AAN7T9R3_9PEZI|nr:hypothetical protein LTR62_008348 [Meristemomyces frigidus]